MTNAKLLFASAVLASPFIITGLCFVFMELRVRTWPSVPGKILGGKWRLGDNLSPVFKARYSYSVHGKNYDNSRVTMADWFFASEVFAIRKFQKMFPVGREAMVYYDPANPERSVLYKTGYGHMIFLFVCGIGTFVVLMTFGPEYRAEVINRKRLPGVTGSECKFRVLPGSYWLRCFG